MIYAVGDIHGYADQLDRALALIEADGGPDAEIVFLGDFVDRGPDSKGVLDRLVRGQAESRNWRFVLGNHDRMFLRFVTEGQQHDDRIKSGLSWMNPRLGGTTTLRSYGVGGPDSPAFQPPRGKVVETLVSWWTNQGNLSDQEVIIAAREAVPDAHLNFLATLPLWHETDDLLFVHAGIRPGIPLEEQEEDDLIWIRDGWLEDDRDHGKLVVHGHTALDTPEHHGNRVNLDGGAGYGNRLVPAAFDAGEVFTLWPEGRRPLVPA
ncbi:metallophosphoesterase family protein [Aestuariibius sp. 2305UL40-4]|uniref:metallophosphoesterase family protein n=1 Tax=Aestuariibius violaceus TaxID=3234132 RepID=UPI00345EC9AF